MRHLLQSLRLLALPLALFAAAPAPAAEPVVPERFLPQLAAQLATQFGVAGELQLDLLRGWVAPATPAADWTMTVVVPPQTLVPQMIVRARLVSAGRTLGEWNLPVRAQLWAEVFAVRQPVARGELLDAAVLEPRRADLLRDKDAVPATTDLAPLSASRPIAAGALLTWHDVARRALVQRGSRVDVVATYGALTITMRGLAMQSGALGETITVRNPESRRDFSAVVTAENQARVAF